MQTKLSPSIHKCDDERQIELKCKSLKSSRPGESHPQPLTDPDVNLSIHPAPIVQPMVENLSASDKTASAFAGQLALASEPLSGDGISTFCISSSPI